MVKGKDMINKFKYLVMFDLASRQTGVCVWDIPQHRPLMTKTILVTETEWCQKVNSLWNNLEKLFEELTQEGCSLSEILVSKEAMPKQLHGGSSTVQTFIALARSHAILDLFLFEKGVPYYDDVGVYPASTHAHIKHVRGWDSKHKVEKQDIADYVHETYGDFGGNLDETDAVFLAQTLIESKWDKDIKEQVRTNNRHIKTLKSPHAIAEWKRENERLLSLLINK